MKRVSVVMPVYNVRPYLSECLDSLLEQTERDIEIICVDDGSTDGSAELLSEYATKDRRIRVVSNHHQGAGAARNCGIALADGEYLSIVDADDVFAANMLETAADHADEVRAEITIFRHNRIDHRTGRLFDLPPMSAQSKYPTKPVFCAKDISTVSGNWMMTVYGWTWDKLFRTSFIREHMFRFQVQPVFNDMLFTYLAVGLAKRIAYLPTALMWQRINRPDSTTGKVDRYWHFLFSALLALQSHFNMHGIYESNRYEFCYYAVHMMIFALNQLSSTSAEKFRSLLSSGGLELLDVDLSRTGIYEPIERERLITFLSNAKEPVSLSPHASDKPKPINKRQHWHAKSFHGGFLAGMGESYSLMAYSSKVLHRLVKCYCDEGAAYTIKRAMALGRKKDLSRG